MLIKASLNNIIIAPRKVRLVADLIRGASFGEAERQLIFSDKKSALPMLKLLRSARANARANFNIQDADLLRIKEVRVDEGPHSLKRFFPRAMGRAYPIMKRMSRINLILETKEVKVNKKNKDTIDNIRVDIAPKIKKEKADKITELSIKKEVLGKKNSDADHIPPERPYGSSGEAKKRFFSRQLNGFGKKFFRRKSV
ncbi:MAG: 50S ribosomal protein L22 [Parcubacteria group bacterium GW2011_GWA2_38_13b]|nr:MAG: 50S ribosomal protein L22 [Parcubacteria group bacterium GW2011_GWA2_38_13b]